MISVSFRSNGSVRLPRVSFTRADMRVLGDTGLESVKERVAMGVGSNDAGMPPLAGLTVRGDSRSVGGGGYRGYKARVTGRSIRDLRLTGQMLDNLQVREAGDDAAVIEFTDPKAKEKAMYNEQRTPWLSFSPTDQDHILAAAARLFREAVRRGASVMGLARNPLARRAA